MDLLNRDLPKWPQMLVTGIPVTPDQAKEIIRRTDSFFDYPSGNDHKFVEWAKAMLRMPAERWWPTFDAWREKWGYTPTSYVKNSWISCSYIMGPHGWCHPDGQIGYIDNIGKWPSVKDVLDDWIDLAQVFPFLNIGVTLFDREWSEGNRQPVVSIRVLGSTVTLVDPAVEDVHAEHPRAFRRYEKEDHDEVGMECFTLSPSVREHAIPKAWIEEWAKR